MTDLADRFKQIEAAIEAACRKAGRRRESVRLLLATKTVSPERLREAARLGYAARRLAITSPGVWAG